MSAGTRQPSCKLFPTDETSATESAPGPQAPSRGHRWDLGHEAVMGPGGPGNQRAGCVFISGKSTLDK